MRKRPARAGWIELVFKRRSGGQALQTGFLLDHTRRFLSEELASHPGEEGDLRRAAIHELDSEDGERIALALVVLSVVGLAEDLARLERFAEDDSEVVRRAVKACRFQLRRARRDS